MPEEKKYPTRTNRQNKALHVLFSLLANELNDNGLDMKRTLKPEIDIKWTSGGVKEYLWRPIMKAQVNKQSTTELNTKEIDEIFDTINKYLGEKHGLHVPFPSVQDVILKQEAERNAKRK